MTQPEVFQHLAAYADGELDAAARARIEQALAADRTCQDAVVRWQALRHCARRALTSEPVPGDLYERIHRSLVFQRRVRTFRLWGFPGLALAAAALVVLAISLRNPSPAADSGGLLVHANEFARVYERCGYTRHHTLTDVVGRSLAEVGNEVKKWDKVDFTVYLPDLAGNGYQLAGVCPCFPRDREIIRVVHANYVQGAFQADRASAPETVVSFFSLSRPVELSGQQPLDMAARPGLHPQRKYMVARDANNVTVVKWNEGSASVAACSCIPQDQLVSLVDSMDLAAAAEQPGMLATARAALGSSTPLAVGAVLVAAIALLLRAAP